VVSQIGVNALLGTLVTALAVAVAERSTDGDARRARRGSASTRRSAARSR